MSPQVLFFFLLFDDRTFLGGSLEAHSLLFYGRFSTAYSLTKYEGSEEIDNSPPFLPLSKNIRTPILVSPRY